MKPHIKKLSAWKESNQIQPIFYEMGEAKIGIGTDLNALLDCDRGPRIKQEALNISLVMLTYVKADSQILIDLTLIVQT